MNFSKLMLAQSSIHLGWEKMKLDLTLSTRSIPGKHQICERLKLKRSQKVTQENILTSAQERVSLKGFKKHYTKLTSSTILKLRNSVGQQAPKSEITIPKQKILPTGITERPVSKTHIQFLKISKKSTDHITEKNQTKNLNRHGMRTKLNDYETMLNFISNHGNENHETTYHTLQIGNNQNLAIPSVEKVEQWELSYTLGGGSIKLKQF